MNVEWRHKNTHQRGGFTGNLVDMRLNKKDFSVGRCKNSTVIRGNMAVWITEKIESKQDSDAGNKHDGYPGP